MSLELEPFFNTTVCYAKPIGAGMCANGTRACPPTFGHFGEFGTPFTAVLGMNYLNTSFLAVDETSGDELWQWTDVQPTLMPNGTMANVTCNLHVPCCARRRRWPDRRRLGP